MVDCSLNDLGAGNPFAASPASIHGAVHDILPSEEGDSCLEECNPTLSQGDMGPTLSPWADTAIPATRTLRAALTS